MLAESVFSQELSVQDQTVSKALYFDLKAHFAENSDAVACLSAGGINQASTSCKVNGIYCTVLTQKAWVLRNNNSWKKWVRRVP